MKSRLAFLFPALVPLVCHGEVDFARDVQPILNAKCTACHGGVKEAGHVSFIYRDKVLGKGESGKPVVVPGAPNASEMIRRIVTHDPDDVMPKPEHGPRLPDKEIATLTQWVKEGAKWGEHWSFVKPERHPAPAVSNAAWCRNPVDAFVLSRLDTEKLKPSPEADKASLLRRASLDLTGLPPSPAELVAFEKDTSPDAYEKQVDRLLASPAFGERWASVWMDVARYADSEGLGLDRRRDVWKYRDWLIEAFNADMPFDRFATEQLAGDLLPNPTLDQLVATTFQRLTQSNEEGGTDDEEFRVAAVLDRVNTTWEVFQGQTFGCVQCHSHPYDPIQHDEYYKFSEFFNQTRDWDLNENLPVVRVPLDRTKHAEAGGYEAAISKAESSLYEIHGRLNAATAWNPVKEMTATGKGTKLKTVIQSGWAEFRTEGNVASNSVHTLAFPAAADSPALTALRLELLPLDEAKARLTPEWGSFLKKIEVSVLPADGSPARPVPLARLIGDEEHPLFDPENSLKGKQGWGPYSKIDRSRWCVMIPQAPIALAAGDKVQVTLSNGGTIISSFPMVSKRGRLSITADPAWTNLLTRPEVTALRDTIAQADKKLDAIPSTTVPVMRDVEPAARRETHVFVRGNWLDKGTLVEKADVPAIFPRLPKDAPANRLGLARWLTSTDNPLTARVAVNRFWLELFGTGIVETAEDFGSSGVKPSHPELLDDLAVRFETDMKWSMKRLLREIATSSTYRQSSVIPPGMQERDQSNRLLARGPRQRLTAEMARDNALALSGLLSAQRLGSPAYPPLPPGVWKPFDAGDTWKTPMEGQADRYRRSVYTYWKRSIPYPTFSTFDAPTRELCSKRRIVSNTPLQALTVLNDPAFDECTRALAKRIQELPGDDRTKLAAGYQLTTSRTASPQRLDQLLKLHQDLTGRFTANPDPKAGATPEAAAYNVTSSSPPQSR
ncbi:MAG: PSD1 and planctomycete cytochrome C domain-containing protein [Luteolibacter sp.]